MKKEELAAKLGKNMKITTTRLGELTKQGIVFSQPSLVLFYF